MQFSPNSILTTTTYPGDIPQVRSEESRVYAKAVFGGSSAWVQHVKIGMKKRKW